MKFEYVVYLCIFLGGILGALFSSVTIIPFTEYVLGPSYEVTIHNSPYWINILITVLYQFLFPLLGAQFSARVALIIDEEETRRESALYSMMINPVLSWTPNEEEEEEEEEIIY